MDQELQSEMLAGSWWTLLHMRWVDAKCVLTRWQHFLALNGVMAAILKVQCRIKNPTRCILTWRTIEPNFILIRSEMMEP